MFLRLILSLAGSFGSCCWEEVGVVIQLTGEVCG